MPAQVSRQEIQQILADSGYSAGQREERLKEALTILSAEEAEADGPDCERSRLIREIEATLDRQAENQDAAEHAEDTQSATR